MDPITQQGLAGAAGASGDPVYVDDLFATKLYRGNSTGSSSQNVITGLDNTDGKALIWQKARRYFGSNSYGFNHYLTDTERGATKVVMTNQQGGEVTETAVTSFLTTGFTAGGFVITNNQDSDNVAWNFKAHPGFFDIITWTGDGTTNGSKTVSHNLEGVPGCVLVKRTSSGNKQWMVYHKSLYNGLADNVGVNQAHLLYFSTSTEVSQGTGPVFTADSMTLYNSSWENESGSTYVAYLFADNDQRFGTNQDEAIIKCGVFNGTNSVHDVNIGFEPQWMMWKAKNANTPWMIVDDMRAFTDNNQDSRYLYPDNQQMEGGSAGFMAKHSNGFRPVSGSYTNQSGYSYVYVAIARPHKPPESGYHVFNVDRKTGGSNAYPQYSANFPPDLVLRRDDKNTSGTVEFITRIRNSIAYPTLASSDYNAGTSMLDAFNFNNGWMNQSGSDTQDYAWMFKRAAGFMDIVTYDGQGTSKTIKHNLRAKPELVIIRKLASYIDWQVYAQPVTSPNSNWWQNRMYANYTNGADSNTNQLTAEPTDDELYVGGINAVGASGSRYMAFLFASVEGVSKIGTYTGSHPNNQVVQCGFSPRFVLTKRADATGNWSFFDTHRGINNAASDPVLNWNTTSAEVTNLDQLFPHNTGFGVFATGSAEFNSSNGEHLFLAIA